jgi:hypothetical protein
LGGAHQTFGAKMPGEMETIGRYVIKKYENMGLIETTVDFCDRNRR